MTVMYAAIAVAILAVAYAVRGPKYTLGAVLLLGALYIGLLWKITTSM